MDFPKKNEDKLNTIVILSVGLASSALVYAAVIACQAFFRAETNDAEIQSKARGVLEVNRLKREQLAAIRNSNKGQGLLAIDDAKLKIVAKIKQARAAGKPEQEALLVPKVGASDKPSYQARPGIPIVLDEPATNPGEPTDPATAPAVDGAASSANPGAASANPPATGSDSGATTSPTGGGAAGANIPAGAPATGAASSASSSAPPNN